MSSPEAHPQERPLSAEQQEIWGALVKQKALRSLQTLEAFYLSKEEQKTRKNISLTNERYQEWLAWMEKMDADPTIPFKNRHFVDEGVLAENAKTFMRWMEAFAELRATQRLSESTKKKLGIELREGEYLVSVDYGPLPPTGFLDREFSVGVSNIFDGRPFEKHPSCRGMDESNGMRFMKLFHFDGEIGSEEAIARADKEGYRPATEKELYGFAKVCPEPQREFWIIALGALAMGDDYRRVVGALQGDGERILGCCQFDDRFDESLSRRIRALFVRKESL